MGERLSGRCLCGAVRFEATPKSDEAAVCHCGMCRRWAGGIFMAVSCEAVDVADETALGVYRSSEYGERVFCRTCGSSLFWRMQDGSHVAVCLPAFDDSSRFRFTSEIYIDEKPASYSFSNATNKMTGSEFLAAVTEEGA